MKIHHRVSRRSFLLGAGSVSVLSVLAACAPTTPTPTATAASALNTPNSGPPSPTSDAAPPAITATATSVPQTPSTPTTPASDQVRAYTIEAKRLQFDAGAKTVTTWGYNGVVPGPELRLRQGETLRVTVRNALPAETTIHWHGVRVPNPMDGVPDVTQPAIEPGASFTYASTVPNAGTYMYHSHVGVQLDRGLYGPLIVEPTRETLRYDRDFSVVIDDWLDGLAGTPEDALKRLIAGGDQMGGASASPSPQGMGGTGSTGGMSGMGGMAATPTVVGMDHTSTSGMGVTPGMGGGPNTAPAESPPDIVYPLYLINGKPSTAPAEFTVKKGDRVRLRLINPSGSTIYRVALAGHRLTVTHTDGQPVEPVTVDVVRVGMGERYDVIVEANNPGVWQLAAHAEGTAKQARALVRYVGSTATPPPVDFTPAELGKQLLLYSMLKAAPEADVPSGATPDQVIPLTLSGGMGQYVWAINNQVFPKADPISIGKGKRIRFALSNPSMMPHPMHLHGHFFQVDNGSGRGPLKDTVIVEPMQQLAIDWLADNPGAWAFHCHNIYHAETGMMRVVKVG